jgi:hypothetical protein
VARHRNGDEGGASVIPGGRVVCHVSNHALEVNGTIGFACRGVYAATIDSTLFRSSSRKRGVPGTSAGPGSCIRMTDR